MEILRRLLKSSFGGYRLMVRLRTVDAIMSVRFWLTTLRHKQQLFLSLTVNQMNRKQCLVLLGYRQKVKARGFDPRISRFES